MCSGENLSKAGESVISSQEDIVFSFRGIDLLIDDFNAISVEETFQIIVGQVTYLSTLHIWIKSSDAYNIIVTDVNGTELSRSIMIFENCTTLVSININKTLDKFQAFTFKMNYNLNTKCVLIQENPAYYFFQYTSLYSYNTTNLRIRIRLPEKGFVHTDGAMPPYLPDNGYIEGIGGYIWIIWLWSSEDLHLMPFPLVQTSFRISSQIPAIWIIVVGPVLGTILGATSVYWWMRKKGKKSLEKIGKIFLTDDQKLILKIVLDNEGKITQKELIKRTKFTKSKISRNLFPLEEYGLLRKEKWGREFKCYITETGEKMLE